MTMREKHVLGFSCDGKLFALINDEGILRIWDTETNELKQEYTPNLHLADPCTTLVWITAHAKYPTEDGKRKKSRRSTNICETSYIALGTSKGIVSLYSYAEAKIERNFDGEGHSGKVTSLVEGEPGTLYTCGEDNQVIEWSVPTEKQLCSWSVGPEKPCNITYISTSRSIAVGARQIKVYSVETHELLHTFSGHATEINLMQSLCVSDHLQYIVTTSRMDHNICLWKIGKRARTKCCTLLVEDIAHCLTCKINKDNVIIVACVTRNGLVYLYSMDANSITSNQPVKPKLTITIASDSTTTVEPIDAIALALQHTYNQDEILLGYGDTRFLMFEHLKPNFSKKTQVLVRSNPKSVLKLKTGKGKATGTDKALKILTPIVDAEDVHYKSSLSATKKKIKPLDMPMETRLQNLNMDASTIKGKTQPHSKAQLLVQALHSKDATLLRSVLSTKDITTIQMTLQRLPVQYVGTLVDELTLLMQQKHTNVEYSVSWLKVLCQTHSSQLMALGADDLLDKFGPCLGIIEQRANCLKDLSKLNGRLQLLVSQIKRNIEGQRDDLNNENLLIFEDCDTSESELEEGDRYVSGNEEWNEEDDDDDDDNDEDNSEKDVTADQDHEVQDVDFN